MALKVNAHTLNIGTLTNKGVVRERSVKNIAVVFRHSVSSNLNWKIGKLSIY